MALKKCDECGKEMSTKADACPHCGAKNTSMGGCTILFLVVLGVMVIGYALSPGGGDDYSNPDEWKYKNNETMAYVMVQGFVEKKLKSPSTAEFAKSWKLADDDIKKLDGQKYSINSYVDSENGFGANIRTKFTAEIEQVSDGEWKLLNLEFK